MSRVLLIALTTIAAVTFVAGADVNAIADGVVANHGWMLMDDDDWWRYDIPAARFHSKEHEDPDLRPHLEVEYTQRETCWYEYGERYSIIVMGGNEPSHGQLYRWYWGDTHGMYTQLKDIGFTDENIYFLSYGDSAAAHPDHVDATSIRASIRDAYAWAADVCTEDDLLYIYWVDHGSQTAFLAHDGNISHSELGTLTDAITAKVVIGAYNPCYSGCVIDDLSRPGLITVTSQDCYHGNSWGWAGNWRRALRGAPEDSIDTNGDGHVSMTEAYEWICPRSQAAGEHSMYDDNGDEVGHECTDPGFDRNDPAKDGYFGRYYALDGWAVCLVAVEEPDLTGHSTRLLLATPNPFGHATTLRFALAREGLLYLDVFSVEGRRVATPYEGFMEAGVHAISWQGRRDDGVRLESGMYYMRLITDRDVRTERLCVLR